MIKADDAIVELLQLFESGGLNAPFWETDIARWTGSNVIAEERLLDDVAAELAQGYASRRYSFEFCEWAVNALHGATVAGQLRIPQPPYPKLFGRIYEAFDRGEYHRREDKSDDPVAEHTKPAIAAILADL